MSSLERSDTLIFSSISSQPIPRGAREGPLPREEARLASSTSRTACDSEREPVAATSTSTLLELCMSLPEVEGAHSAGAGPEYTSPARRNASERSLARGQAAKADTRLEMRSMGKTTRRQRTHKIIINYCRGNARLWRTQQPYCLTTQSGRRYRSKPQGKCTPGLRLKGGNASVPCTAPRVDTVAIGGEKMTTQSRPGRANSTSAGVSPGVVLSRS